MDKTITLRELGSLGILSMVMSDEAFDILVQDMAQHEIPCAQPTHPMVELNFEGGSVKIYRENPYKL